MVNGIETELIKLNTNVTFLNKVKIKEALDKVPRYTVLTIDGSNCNFIDYDILEIISEFETKAKDRHIELHLIGIEKSRCSLLIALVFPSPITYSFLYWSFFPIRCSPSRRPRACITDHSQCRI